MRLNMLAFFRRVWSFARPYSTRLVLGQACGILFALANGLLFLIIKLVIDLIFSGAANTSLAAHVQKAPALLRPLLASPSDKAATRQEGWEDFLWVLFMSPEFQFVR